MRFLHLADLHLGKVLHKRSFLSDQVFILQQILEIAETEQIDAVLIAGDVYQRSVPSAEAMTAFSDFLTFLSEKKRPCYIISGNHDSAERIAYLSPLAQLSGIYIAGAEPARFYTFSASDAFGEITLHLLPFTAPAHVRARYPEEAEDILTYDDAIRVLTAHHPIDPGKRNVLIAHQYLTGAQTCDSEELAIGGLDNVSAALFADYDYAALGHLHGPQQVMRETIRYAGSPLKYSFSEAAQKKSVTVCELGEKGSLSVTTRELEPRHDMRQIRGLYNDLMRRDSYEGTKTDDYIGVVLTDEDDVPGAIEKLRVVYPNIIKLSYDNKRARALEVITEAAESDQMTEMELFSDLYLKQNGQEMNEEQRTYLGRVIDQVKEGEQ